MFLINITPWRAHKNMGDSTDFFDVTACIPTFSKPITGSTLTFKLQLNYFEKLHCDKTTEVPADHECTEFTPDLHIPSKWRANVLNCGVCKRNLMCFLCFYFVRKVQNGPTL